MKLPGANRVLCANHVLTATYRLPRWPDRGWFPTCHWLRMAAIRPSFLPLERIRLDARSPMQADWSRGGNLGTCFVCPKRFSM